MEFIIVNFLLVFFRILGFFILTPVFGRREFPVQGRLGVSALIAVILYPVVNKIPLPDNLWDTVILFIRETAVGLSIGFITFVVFSAVYICGEIIDLQMGFGIVNVIDPQTNAQIPVMGNFFYILTILIFLSINGHHVLLNALMKSYDILPLGGAGLHDSFLEGMLKSFFEMFAAGVKMSIPVVAATFLADFALGVIARTVPQMNVFIVGLPFKIIIGFIALIIALPMYVLALDVLFSGSYKSIQLILRGMLNSP
ncbi:flagellar biosynthetic protein FliR [Thermosediminibacter oceani]|uniref:Flagellar biosynthetic protein FliR n=1 Tax=Thermosediminibacter oceani (strain ATCC BAA-1034 / DSM 16646 / JW/IW-1228P) TaxID=555079 RepID=D9S399_THEOJ|nr:flagellar biosynthetic protein FliR [Thermosediminibacter oceani]ADL07876.1 flagellar biosynthetic protein FliR [Thermosediminibacter oceani DSM 16646]